MALPSATAGMKRKTPASPTEAATPAKRKRDSVVNNTKPAPVIIDLTADSDNVASTTSSASEEPWSDYEEERLFRYRVPASYKRYYERAVTQRMFVINRTRSQSYDCPHGFRDCPAEIIDLAGTTGNIYTVTITHEPTCTCPNFLGGNLQCKHIIYCMVQVLKAPYDLQHQLALLTTELHEIFDTAGPLPADTISAHDKAGRRHAVEGDCAICCEDMDPDVEAVVWCRASCGNNLHATCFQRWAATRKGAAVTCPYCRAPWGREGGGDLGALSEAGTVGPDGYVNVAGALGISARRDYGVYGRYWAERRGRDGLLGEDWEEGI